ncbi:MAG: hypothetical protein ACFB22_07795 [Rhodothalassiaceae bacterium]
MTRSGLFLLALLLGPPAQAQSPAQQWVSDCLATPSRECALRTALRVTADEELAIERAKVLLALADSFRVIGAEQRAVEALSLAAKEARDIGISIGTEQHFVEIAGLYGAMGRQDAADRIITEIEDRILRARARGEAALGLLRAGRAEASAALLTAIEVPAIAQEYALRAAEYLVRAEGQTDPGPALAAADTLLNGNAQRFYRELGQLRLATALARAGRAEDAQAIRAGIDVSLDRSLPPDFRAELLAGLARLDIALGDREAATRNLTAATRWLRRSTVTYDRNRALGVVAAAALAADQRDLVARLAEDVEDLTARTRLIDTLAPAITTSQDRALLVDLARQTLPLIDALEGRFERDQARYDLVTALIDAGAGQAAAEIIAAIEDDDQQARALAYLARLLS